MPIVGNMQNAASIVRYLGLWTLPAASAPIRRFIYLVYKLLVVSLLGLFIAALFADLLLCTDDLLIMTDDGCILAGLLVIFFKIVHFQIYSKNVEHLVGFVNEDVKSLHESNSRAHYQIWRRYVFLEKLASHGFTAIGFLLILALMFFSPTEPGALPIRSRYPFDVAEAPLHHVMFIFQGIVLSIAMLSILGMENRKQSVVRDAGLSRRDFVADFTNCIRHHQRIIEFVDKLDKFFSPMMFVQLIASNVMICLTGFQAIAVSSTNATGQLKFAVYLSAAFAQLFYWCWCGNEMIYQSTSVTEVLWLCSWDELEMSRIKPLITIPMMRATKPLTLTAGKFYTMSMIAFINVLSGSYSFFTLLNKMNEPAD